MSKPTKFADFIEEMRKSRNVSRENLTHDIISLRQYYRFINGESSLKNETVSALLDRMEIDPMEAYSRFAEYDNQDHFKLKAIYQLFREFNLEEGFKLFRELDYNSLNSQRNKKMYEYLEIFYLYETGEFSEKVAVDEYIELIDYPNILSNEVITFYEFNALFRISKYMMKAKGDYTVSEFLYTILTNPEKYYLVHRSRFLTSFYAEVGKGLGRSEQYEKSLKLLNEGYKYAIRNGIMSGLAVLLTTKAVTESHMGLIEKRNESLTKLFALLKVQDTESKNKVYEKYVKDVFDMTYNDFIQWK